MSAEQINSAIKAVPGHPNPDIALGLAEGLTIAYFTSQQIDSDQFNRFCERIRHIGVQLKERSLPCASKSLHSKE